MAGAMATEEAKTIYKERPQPPSASTPRREIGACTNCESGLLKVKAVALWYALAHNLMRAASLRAAVAGAA